MKPPTPKRQKLNRLISLRSVLDKFDWDQRKYIAHEFQNYGCYLAEQLGDPKHKSLYIKLAKEYPRGVLEEALSFVKEVDQVKNRGRLFMWKLGQLKNGKLSKKGLVKEEKKI